MHFLIGVCRKKKKKKHLLLPSLSLGMTGTNVIDGVNGLTVSSLSFKKK